MNQALDFFKAMADETRLRILALLACDGELCVCDIMAALELPQSTISRHLGILRKAGLVNDRKEGLWVYYTLVEPSTPLNERLEDLLKRVITCCPESGGDRKRLAAYGKNSHCD